MGENNNNSTIKLDIDYVWEEWNIRCRRDLIIKIQNANEQEKINIAKEQELINAFLLKRNWDHGLRNFVYSQIENDPRMLLKIKKEWLQIVSNQMITDHNGEETQKKDSHTNNIFQTDSLNKIIKKFKSINQKSIEYFKERLEKSQDENDLETAQAAEILIREYSLGTFSITGLYAEPFIYSKDSRPQKYHYISNSFLISTLRNYMVYWSLDNDMPISMGEFSELLARNLHKKIYDLLFDFFEISPSKEGILRKTKVMKDLTSIASQIYFESLKREEKVDLLNQNFGIRFIIEKIRSSEIVLELMEWNLLIFNLKNNGYIKLAIELLKSHIEKKFFEIEEKYKFWFLDMLATLYRSLNNHEAAFEYYKRAHKWVPKSIKWDNIAFIKTLSYQFEENTGHSKNYYKAISLKNVGESYGYLGDLKIKDEFFKKVEKIASKSEDPKDKYGIYGNLAGASRRLCDFASEREYLNLAMDNYDSNWEDYHVDYIDKRASILLDTEMDSKKLDDFEKREDIFRFLEFGRKAQKIFNFSESADFFQMALNIIEDLKDSTIKILALKGIAYSYLFLGNWEQSKKNFEKIIEIEENFEAEAHLSIIYFLINEKEKSISFALKICEKFENYPIEYTNFFKEFVQNALNYIGENGFKDFFSELEKREFDMKGIFFLDIGSIVADFGFFEFAIELFEKAEKLISEVKRKAECLANIGSVYANQDIHKNAIEYYEKAISLDKNNPSFFGNIAVSYGCLLDFLSARKNIETALKLAKQHNYHPDLLFALNRQKELFVAFSENVLNTEKLSSQIAKDAMITAERLFFDYRKKDTLIDASPMIENYAKALEVILNEQLSRYFKPVLKREYGDRYIKDEEIWKAFGRLRNSQTINLGSWIYIISAFLEKNIKPSFQAFKECIKGVINDQSLVTIKDACEFINPFRVSKAHRENITLKDVLSVRNQIILHINRVIDIFH